MCLDACCNVADSFVWSELVTEDLDQIRIHVRYGPDALAIQRPTHEMIQRFIPVCAVKTRRWFGSKITSFHVSVCYYLISLYTVVNKYLCFTFIISSDCLRYFISIITYITSWVISECSPYLFSWFEQLSTSFYVL